jgi:hypothetical protein
MEFNCAEYLETVLPGLLQRSVEPELSREATVQFVVRDRPECLFFYELGPRTVVARRGISDQVDLTVSIYSSDLYDLSRNALDAGRALRTSRLKVLGDSSLLAWMSTRLSA